MLTKFEAKTARVKGIAFHSSRPWVIASLHSGVIHLYDYRMGTLIDKFDEHDGPVRGIDFHDTQPLFVSGGDDYKIKVWNYKTRRCLFTLNGHLDYIRTTYFHNDNPWVISASDDQTIRIWNWQSRSCICVMTGHNHYVMCANFHPTENLVVSASLDQTIRVWDITGLRKKNIAPAGFGRKDDTDLFGSTDVVVKHVLEGHDRGVNWAAFHPTSPLVVSGADDRQVKLWRMNDAKAWEVDTCRGHFNNVVCVLFHPRQNLIISGAEDRSIRVWDVQRRATIQTFRREHDRFWVVAAHPEVNLFAAGHDSGLVVFKLERERPGYVIHGDKMLYVKDRIIRTLDFRSSKDHSLAEIRRHGTGAPQNGILTMSYNPAENAALITAASDGGVYELYMLPKDGSSGEASCKRGAGKCAVWVARNRFAVLDKFSVILVKDMSNNKTKQVTPGGQPHAIFRAGTGRLIVAYQESVSLLDIQQSRMLATLSTSRVRYVVWNSDMSRAALLCKHSIIICDKKLQQLCTVYETIRVKSAAWDASGVLVYTTLNHLKYALPNGDSGIIRTLDDPIYITKVKDGNIFCLDRNVKAAVMRIDPTEYKFKLALVNRSYDQVLYMVRNAHLPGQAIIAYLQQKGYPEVALHFVKDHRARFSLALECGNIEAAKEAALQLNEPSCWNELASAALKYGDHEVVELAYQRTRNLDKLAFLYLITGNTQNLRKMLKIAEVRKDISSQFHAALFLGDVQERVRILQNVGQGPLAYLTAATAGFADKAAEIATNLGIEKDLLPEVAPDATVLLPPEPAHEKQSNWPQLTISKGFFDNVPSSKASTKFQSEQEVDEDAGDGWGEDSDDDLDDLEGGQKLEAEGEDDGSDGWGDDDDDDDLDLDGDIGVDAAGPTDGDEGDGSYFVPPAPGHGRFDRLSTHSQKLGDLAAAGNVDEFMKRATRSFAIKTFEPLKAIFLNLSLQSQTWVPCSASTPPLARALLRNFQNAGTSDGLPAVGVTLESLASQLQEAYRIKNFSNARNVMRNILHQALFLVVTNKTELQEAKQLVDICREYIIGFTLEITRKETKDNKVRAAELAAYFTHCQLQPVHLVATLKTAQKAFYEIGNKKTCSTFSRRLIDLGPKKEVLDKAKKFVQACDKNPVDAEELDYDPFNPFKVSPASLKPIYKGTPEVVCPLCSSAYEPSHAGSVCQVCDVAEIGANVMGLDALL